MHVLDSVAVNFTTRKYRVPALSYALGESVFVSHGPPLWRLRGGFFQGGWDRSSPSEQRVGLLNLKDGLSLIMELLLAGA